MSGNLKVNTTRTAAGKIGAEFDIANLNIARVVIEDANAGNELTFRAKIDGQSTFTVLTTISGNTNETIDIQAYDKLEIEITTFDASGPVRIVVSGFTGLAGGSSVPSGEVAIGTGSGLSSDADFNYDTGTDTLNVPNISLDGADLGLTLYKPETVITLNAGDITAKNVTLSEAPTTPAKTRVSIINGSDQAYGTDFTVSGTTLNWNGLGLDGLLESGDKLLVTYN